MTAHTVQFGYYPRPLDITSSLVQINTLSDLADTVDAIEGNDGLDGDWLYAPPQGVRDFMSGEVQLRPYPSRVFGLPKTHELTCAHATSEEHLDFHLWSLSFFTGMRLTATEAGFLDATPIKPGKLVDFVLLNDLAAAVELTERFWRDNLNVPQRTQLVAAAIHALFIAQYPPSLQFEQFLYCYTALDACYALAASMTPPTRKPTHAERVAWLCRRFGMDIPAWAAPALSRTVEVAAIRNATLHEALFMGQPLGFALHGTGTGANLPLEMEALICRLVVALLGGHASDYVRSPITTRQRHGLRLA